ncbi:MAG: 4-hydroxy-3-methylbut-2-enyl diphosphate reductase, partial [Clostridia bacterium]|nr:4-hydroxy-3-methylbut-2-enyl diphosphate reductase [Clostridia bacterium]
MIIKNCNIIDATCPFVKKIHNIVHKNYVDGKQVIIVGDANH